MTERTMTPVEAAALLEVAVDAELEQVERAFRYQAQRSHPDRLTAATPAELAAAAARFDRFTQARAVLREVEAERMRRSPGSAGPRPTGEGAGSGSSFGSGGEWAGTGRGPATGTPPGWAADEPYQPVQPAGPWLFWVWTALYALAATISVIGGPLPQSQADLWLRLVPLGLASVAFARTGRTVFLVIVLILGTATAVLTVVFASFGPLVALQLLIAPVLGLVALGRPKQLRRRSSAPPSPAG
ncbi:MULTISPECIES: hypothetical protein [unclassified Cryobacterium]|uniref:hypothetical protein n=1 Tax=unclassified Cryobacterium TaxID=2649013 RepID=UPI001069CB33|nr:MULTISPECIES: hypothetical protein [unclassified Cryobacterium]TFC50270.1 hypothetical protein E3O68_17830 [Cryobacterium sp. TMB3-1-2]TFC71996.1 hypothetical protein E3T21_07575 [Cryobacterium sp. TMB3-15]TFC78589.1 hypothetical protein E3T22_03770 [Cryobacterium sp. TMB3-10]TFD39276.1 hypothetical protein E3T58_15605 [Cryobacterium sp. TMB3-12]